MSYRQSEMYKLTMYLKDLPQQSVSSKKNFQVVDKFRKTCELFLCSKNKRGRVGVQIPCIPFFGYQFMFRSPKQRLGRLGIIEGQGQASVLVFSIMG